MIEADTQMSNDKNKEDDVALTTEFHLHKSQHMSCAGVLHKVIDYTEHRLKKFIKTVSDPQQKAALNHLLEQYKKGMVAIAWRKGRPVWTKLTKDI